MCLTGIIILFSASLISQDFLDAFRLGASQHDEAYGCFEDSQGNLYMSGNFQGTVDFDPGSDEVFITAVSSYDGYLAKYDEDLNYIWALSIGGNDQVNGKKIVVDSDGNTFLAGYFRGEADFDPSGNEYLLQAEEMDGFLAKYDTDGNFIWAFKIGNTNSDIAFDVCLDNNGNVWVSGTFRGDVDFDPSQNEFILNGHGFMDAYMAKYTADGTFLWAGEIGGEMSSFYLPTLTCDNSGNLYFSGYFTNLIDIDPGDGTLELGSNGDTDIFLLKLDAAGNFIWAFSMGGEMQDHSRDIIISNGRVLIAGFIEGTIDFDPSEGEAILTSEGGYDAFIAAYSSDGDFLWVSSVAGADYCEAITLASDDDNNIYFAGSFYGTSDFDPSASTYELTSTGAWDIFAAKYDDQGNFEWAVNAGGNENDYGQNIMISGNQEEVVLCGKFKGWAEFDHNGSGKVLNASGGFDAFLARYGAYSGAGINELNSGFEDLLFYPNPAGDRLFISMPSADNNTHYQIINLLGKQLFTGMLVSELTTIDVSAYAPGIYFIRIEKGDRSVVSKLLIE